MKTIPMNLSTHPCPAKPRRASTYAHRIASGMLIGMFISTVVAAANVAGGATSIDSQIPRCSKTFGDIAINDGGDAAWRSQFTERTNMSSILPLLRNYVLQSNCFRVTTQGTASEGAIASVARQARGSDFRPSEKNGANQRVGADFLMVPTVNFAAKQVDNSNININDIPIFKKLRIKSQTASASAEVTLEIFDARAGVLVASATGIGKVNSTSSPFVSANARPEAASVASAILDAYSQIIPALDNYMSQNPSGGLDVQ